MSDLFDIFEGNEFDVASAPSDDIWEPIPPGKYVAIVEDAKVKRTKAGNGHYIAIVLTIIEGSHKNRKLFDNINIQNPSVQAVEIGKRKLGNLGKALGLQRISDSSQLIGKPVVVNITVRDTNNEVRSYSTYKGAIATEQAPAQKQWSNVNETPGPKQVPPWIRPQSQ